MAGMGDIDSAIGDDIFNNTAVPAVGVPAFLKHANCYALVRLTMLYTKQQLKAKKRY